jgi:hypothetical protein
MHKIRLILIGLVLLGSALLAPKVMAADSTSGSVCEGIGLVSGTDGDCTTEGDSPSVGKIITTAVTLLSYIAGVAGVLMIIIGSFKYITSGGDSGKVENAKSTILYALIGLVIAVLAQALVRFVLNKATTTPPPAPTPTQVSPGNH